MKKRLTKKRKEIMLSVLNEEWTPQALWSEEEGDDFVELYGYTIEEALEALEALVENLS